MALSSSVCEISSSVSVCNQWGFNTTLINANTGPITISLFDGSDIKYNGLTYIFKRVDNSVNSVAIDGFESQLIDGFTTIYLSYNEYVKIILYNGEWFIV